MRPIRAPRYRRVSRCLLGALLILAAGRVFARDTPFQNGTAPAATAACRTASTDETRVSSTGTLRVRCHYDTSTNQQVCNEDFSGGTSYSYTQITQFRSVADFVDDVSRVFFFPHATSITVKFPTSTSTQTYRYDAANRLTSIATASNAGAGGSSVQTFTAWDALGRPTTGRDETQSFVLTYDDGKRLVTEMASAAGALMSVKLDANGNQIETSTASPRFNDSTKITIRATEQICK